MAEIRNCGPDAITGKVNKYAVFAIALTTIAFAIPLTYPYCLLMPMAHICALGFSVVAAVRGNKRWLIFSAVSVLLIAQAVLAVCVEC